jgi:hypothetical protein
LLNCNTDRIGAIELISKIFRRFSIKKSGHFSFYAWIFSFFAMQSVFNLNIGVFFLNLYPSVLHLLFILRKKVK